MKKIWKAIKRFVFTTIILIYALPMLVMVIGSILLLYVFYYPTGLLLTVIEGIRDGKDIRLLKKLIGYFSLKMHLTAGKIFSAFFGTNEK